jgi:hypothetical protein
MPDFIKADTFDIEKTNQYKLSIQVSLNGFSFLAVQSSEKKIVACKSTPLNISTDKLIARHLKEWLENEEFFRNDFQEVKIFIFTERFTIIPNDCDSDEFSQELVSVLFDLNDEYSVKKNKVDDCNSHLYFPVHNDINEVLQLFFPKTRCFHPVYAILEIPMQPGKRNSSVIISFAKNFYLIVKKNNKLILANPFQFSHKNDLVYNVINTFQQLETSRMETDLLIDGVFSDNYEISELLKPYFENISSLKTDDLVINPEITNNRLLLYLSQIH